MKLFSASQIRSCDQFTVRAGGISSDLLMEKAAAQCVSWLTEEFPSSTLYIVVCGNGNNGGDGLAITRLLHRQGIAAKAFLLESPEPRTADCELNYRRLLQLDASLVSVVPQHTFIADIAPHIVIIDALYGTGLNRPLTGWVADFVRHLNTLPNRKISVDTPSGLASDTILPGNNTIFQADHTLTFQFLKRSFLHPETGGFAGRIHILDIGLSQEYIQSTPSIYQTVDRDTVSVFFRKRKPFSHKGTYGTALLIGGSYGMIGAIALSVASAVRSGAGKVQTILPACGYEIIQNTVPEATCLTSGEQFLEHIPVVENVSAIGIGPGMSTSAPVAKAFETFLSLYRQPLVIDADALNLIAQNKELMHLVPAGSVLTPHPKEFERLFGVTRDSIAKVELARLEAMKYNITIVLKDRHTVTVTPSGECWYNLTGNAGLAAGGTGDVLTGLITGLIAQGYNPPQAAMLGVYIHGAAADLALADHSMESLTAGDLPQYFGKAFRAIEP